MNYRPISEAYKWNVEFLIRSRGIWKYTVQRYLKIIPAKWSEFDLRSHGWKHIACEYSSLFCVVSCLKHYMGTSIMSWIDRDIPILIYLQIYEAEILTSTDTLYTLGDKGYNGDHAFTWRYLADDVHSILFWAATWRPRCTVIWSTYVWMWRWRGQSYHGKTSTINRYVATDWIWLIECLVWFGLVWFGFSSMTL